MSTGMKLYSPDSSELMQICTLERDGDQLVIKGTAFGAMPITAQLRAAEARAGLRLLDWRTALFLLTLIFRR
ncbi:hypothetical protein GJV26_02600 [Massilia dura]|uniref:Uncharacterized protein n=1 Tax=Pseudoduganella dura TaxID=321982 RepID=A0A6I3XBC7_9BURK|nr:hypothetical protein [Pseudoduganella dura]MUI11383.1 hypothetical protein [Pseudoduganella dura]GGX95815.1 hypothetical protein GCM10007386_28420 [Pseudoduganella dura]